jgi:hypothetical protein
LFRDEVELQKSCVVYLRETEIVVVSNAMTTHGFEIDDLPITRLTAAQFDSVLGDAILEALGRYRTNVLPPGPRGRQPDPVLKFVGVRTWGQLERSTRNIFVTEELGSITAIPTRRIQKGGYDFLYEFAVRSSTVPVDIGLALSQAAKFCT